MFLSPTVNDTDRRNMVPGAISKAAEDVHANQLETMATGEGGRALVHGSVTQVNVTISRVRHGATVWQIVI